MKVIIDTAMAFNRKPSMDVIETYIDRNTGEIKGITEIMQVNQRLKDSKQLDISFEEFVSWVEDGHSFVEGEFKTDRRGRILGRKTEFVIEKNFIILDCDEFLTIEECIARLDELRIEICFMYTTFSHTDQKHKYRVGIKLKNPVRNMQLYTEMYSELTRAIVANTGKRLDASVKDASRIFFGTNQMFLIKNPNADGYCPVEHGLDGWDLTSDLTERQLRNNLRVIDTYYSKKLKDISTLSADADLKSTSHLYIKSFLLKAFIEGGIEYDNYIKINPDCSEVGRLRYKHLIVIRIFMYFHGLVDEFEEKASIIHPGVNWKAQRSNDLNSDLKSKYIRMWGELHGK